MHQRAAAVADVHHQRLIDGRKITVKRVGLRLEQLLRVRLVTSLSLNSQISRISVGSFSKYASLSRFTPNDRVLRATTNFLRTFIADHHERRLHDDRKTSLANFFLSSRTLPLEIGLCRTVERSAANVGRRNVRTISLRRQMPHRLATNEKNPSIQTTMRERHDSHGDVPCGKRDGRAEQPF